MNLAFIGFFVAGVVFAIYAYTFYRMAGSKLPAELKNYSYAYFALALAFLIWSYAALNNDFLVNSILIGNILLLLGSLFMLKVLFNFNKRLEMVVILVGLILSIIFIWARINYFWPAPFVESGVLIFNTQKIISIILSLIFIFIWLPTNMMTARKVAASMPVPGMSFVYSFIYVVSTIAAIFFIAFKTVPMVVTAFVVLGICFIMLIYSNYVANKLLPNQK